MSSDSASMGPSTARQAIEELALEMILGAGWDIEQAGRISSALERVSEGARQAGWNDLEARALRLLDQVADAREDEQADPRELELRIQAGIVNLQRTLARFERQSDADPNGKERPSASAPPASTPKQEAPAAPSPPQPAPPQPAPAEPSLPETPPANAAAEPPIPEAAAPAPPPSLAAALEISDNPLANDPESICDFVLESREHFQALDDELLRLERDPANEELLNSLFRHFHTIKGLAGFLDLNPIRDTAHAVESLLDDARGGKLSITPAAIDLLLAGNDALRADVALVESAVEETPGTPAQLPDRSDLRAQLGAFGRSAEPGAAAPAPLPGPTDAPATTEEQGAAPAEKRGAHRIEALRVDTKKLDLMVEIASELVIAQTIVRHDPTIERVSDSNLTGKFAQLARLTQEIQTMAMGLRMVPVSHLFDRAGRLVRDLSRKADKAVRIERDGGTTEVDKTVVELLSDPFMHMVRNSVDHGLETADERRAAGKPAEAEILFSARHQSGNIVLEISDDGRGIDPVRITKRAKEKGLISPDAELSKSEALELIFAPGFSTAEQITDLSGRGVGMDVVRRNMQDLRGRVTVESEIGLGTTFRLTIPLTLAVIDGLVIGVGDERYVAPLFSVQEMIRPGHGVIQKIEGREELALVRGDLLPIISLAEFFGLRSNAGPLSDQLLIVTSAGSDRLCIAVDRFLGKQEIVIKQLSEPFDRTEGVSGGAILGDGRAALILDIESLARSAARG